MIWINGEVNLRILYCSQNYCPHDHRFLSALAETKRHEVFWFRLEGGDRKQEERALPETIHTIKWDGLRRKQRWLDYFRLKQDFSRIVDDIQPDVIHAGPVQRVAFLAALNGFHPLVTMSWGFDMVQDAGRNLFWKWITRYVLKKSDWLVADCFTVKHIAAKFGFDTKRSTIFPWGVDTALFTPDFRDMARKAVGYENAFLIIHTRSWEPRYGVDIALQGFKKAVEANGDIHMLMLGGGSQSDQIHAFVKKNGLSQNVHFIGYCPNDELVRYYRAGDVYLSASHVDGSSVALLESMACGCVPLVSDIPSNLEWVKNGETGFVFQDGSASNLSNVIIQAAKTDLRTLRHTAREKIEQDADWENGKQKLMDTYQKVASHLKNE